MDPDAIFVQDGNVWTSAGVTAGIDLALALVADDHGRQAAATVARRFHQQSVLTFDTAERRRDVIDAVEVEVPGVAAARLRFAFVADAEVRGRLMGASVTLDGRLILVAALEDLAVVQRFVTALGAPAGDASIRRGHREFVAAA